MINLITKIKKMCVVLSLIAFSGSVFAAPPEIWGSKHSVPYMPYSATASQIIYVSNPSSETIDVTVTAFDDDGDIYDLGVIKEVGANRVTKVNADISNTLFSQGFVSGKVHYEFTINHPDAIIYTSYIAGNYRGYVAVDKSYILEDPTPVDSSL